MDFTKAVPLCLADWITANTPQGTTLECPFETAAAWLTAPVIGNITKKLEQFSLAFQLFFGALKIWS